MLQIEHVTKKYKNFTALTDVNLELETGVYGLLAPNGAGKTTLMKMITTLLFPTEGQIKYNGEDIRKLDGAYREKLGYLPQDFGYYRDYTPEKYLRYIGILKGMPGEKLQERIGSVLELVGLSGEGKKKMKKFSGGMVQRVGIAQALLDDPRILVLDEPTAGLDPGERMRFRKILTALSRDKLVLISTHIVSDVEFIANHIIMIRDRRIYCNDTVEAICGKLTGQVFETVIPAGQLAWWEEQYQVVSQRQEGTDVAVRFISRGGSPGKGLGGNLGNGSGNSLGGNFGNDAENGLGKWRPCKPGLEDVFLYTYQENTLSSRRE